MDRLVLSPVFILSCIRSGSTLLRCILDTHSQIHAPHEMHLRNLRVEVTHEMAELSMRMFDLDAGELTYLLWDRLLHRQLVRSGKKIIVEKTPVNALMWRQLKECWPEARYVFLLRHPANIVQSFRDRRLTESDDEAIEIVAEYIDAVQSARMNLAGITILYEELTTRPADQACRICDFLEVPWEPEMLEYGRIDHGPYVGGVGDCGENIESGRVQPGRLLPDSRDVPLPLRSRCRMWGYAV